MRELQFIVDWIFSFVVGLFLLRLVFQVVRTDFRNPLVQSIVRLTNPLILPLRRILPPIGRIDTASVAAVLLTQIVGTALSRSLGGFGLPGALQLLIGAVLTLLDTTLLLYLFAVFGYVLLSWVSQDGYNPAARVLGSLVEPVLRPLRRALPALGGLDLSPMVALLLIQVLRMVLTDRIAPLRAGIG